MPSNKYPHFLKSTLSGFLLLANRGAPCKILVSKAGILPGQGDSAPPLHQVSTLYLNQ